MARRKKGNRRKGFTLPLAVVGGFMPYGLGLWSRRTNLPDMGNFAVGAITGYVPGVGWNTGLMSQGTMPILLGVIAHKLAGKLGINRALARSGVPLFRI